MRILAVDPGSKRTGLAMSDPDERLAVALPTLAMKGDGQDSARIAEAAQREGAELIVVGLALNMNGTEGPRAAEARTLVEDLRLLVEVPVEAWDERLTTVEAEDRLRAAGLDRREASRRSDAASAIVILERVLEARRAKRAREGPPGVSKR